MKTKLFFLIIYCLLFTECKAQWIQIGPAANTFISSLSFEGSNIYAGSNGVYKSTDNGSTWDYNSYPTAVWCIAVNGAYAFAGSFSSSYYSSNSGQSWIPIPNHSQASGSMLVKQGVLFAGDFISGNGIYKSSDNGQTWSHILSSTGVLAITAQDSSMYAAARWGAIYRSSNSGTNWTQISTIDSTYLNYCILIKGQNIFAGSNGEYYASDSGAVYISSNNGFNWTKTSLHNTVVFALATDNVNIFAGTGRGIYLSRDNGMTWNSINDNMGALTIRALTISNGFIYAGTQTQGIWKRALSDLVGIEHIHNLLPNNFSLSQNYPNPFNPATNIKFQIAKSSDAELVIYDALGKEVETLINKKLEAGEYEANFDGTNLPSGVYFYKLVAGDYKETKKMVLIK